MKSQDNCLFYSDWRETLREREWGERAMESNSIYLWIVAIVAAAWPAHWSILIVFIATDVESTTHNGIGQMNVSSIQWAKNQMNSKHTHSKFETRLDKRPINRLSGGTRRVALRTRPKRWNQCKTEIKSETRCNAQSRSRSIAQTQYRFYYIIARHSTAQRSEAQPNRARFQELSMQTIILLFFLRSFCLQPSRPKYGAAVRLYLSLRRLQPYTICYRPK